MRKIIIYLGGKKEIGDIPVFLLTFPTLKYPEIEGMKSLPQRVREFIMQNKNGNVSIITTSVIVVYTLRLMAKRGEINDADIILYDLNGKQFKMDKEDALFSYYNEDGETNSKDANSICYRMLVELLKEDDNENERNARD